MARLRKSLFQSKASSLFRPVSLEGWRGLSRLFHHRKILLYRVCCAHLVVLARAAQISRFGLEIDSGPAYDDITSAR